MGGHLAGVVEAEAVVEEGSEEDEVAVEGLVERTEEVTERADMMTSKYNYCVIATCLFHYAGPVLLKV